MLLVLLAHACAGSAGSQPNVFPDTRELRLDGLHFQFSSKPAVTAHMTVSDIDGITGGNCAKDACYTQLQGALPFKVELSTGTLKVRVTIPVEWSLLAEQDHRRIRVLVNGAEIRPRAIDQTSVSADVTIPGTVILALRDDQPPGKLRLSSATAADDGITFDWLATGGDGEEGLASSYDMKFGTSAHKVPTFESLPMLPEGPPDGIDEGYRPGTPGSIESSHFSGLAPETRYCLGIRAVDEAGNRGPASVFCARTTAKEPD